MLHASRFLPAARSVVPPAQADTSCQELRSCTRDDLRSDPTPSSSSSFSRRFWLSHDHKPQRPWEIFASAGTEAATLRCATQKLASRLQQSRVLCEVITSAHDQTSTPANVSAPAVNKSVSSGTNVSLTLDRGLFIRESSLKFEDKYSLDAKNGQLGEGGFGAVFKCQHKATGVMRAAKRIPKSVLEADWEMFENEVKALIALDHPHIVKLVEYFDNSKDVVLVFELCDGPDLFDRIVEVLRSKGRFNKTEAGFLLRHMLKAVFCCHLMGYVHRDIKPENFMFSTADKNSNLKLIDLGLSAKSSMSSDSDLEGQRGTVAYMPPEMLAGGKYDRRCDIWGLGIILYIMLVGEPLFSLGADEDKVKEEIMDPRFLPKKLKKKKKTLDPDAYDLLEKMLQRDHTKRIDARKALDHPFIQRTYDTKGGEGAALRRLPSGKHQLHMDEVMRKMDEFCRLPLLKRAALIVLAHLAGTDTDELAPHRLTFRALDRDGSGSLSMEEFVTAVKAEGGEGFVLPVNFESEIWVGVDLNYSGDINFTEFLAATLDYRHFTEAHLFGVFQVLDVDGSGFVDVDDMRLLFPNNTLEELGSMMREVNPEGRLTFQEFLGAMQK
mmetsp:Transcript_22510/g.56898  ORF Transcript_22510/g.56898 Transcript_22510/m.56898 type:complete len:609 (-) Transcript_22510:542-2368(-)|eukprot:CAMPEP_0178999706 /NCGR_PEP_ID=MMETSP0795-20121207/10228_1 /TAXON_ID=88552 /ORGANISM="Amoebophrya sp., Strain Ameob2" /LENGTH=608 /DNA_ID=CAMNT_0020692547 /DNA_START=145 /DNA_END=1971 /DNA_ORIENTATION=-